MEGVSHLAACYVAARAEAGGKEAPAGGAKGGEAPPTPAPLPVSGCSGAADASSPSRVPSLRPLPLVEAAYHRADVAATLYQLLSNRLLMHHEMDSVYAMLAGLLEDPPGSVFHADGGGTWLAGALLRLERGQEAAVLGGVMDAVYSERRAQLRALRSAFDFEVRLRNLPLAASLSF